MNSPFENPDASYLVLVNTEGQHSLWPAFAEVPAGWEVILSGASRAACLAHVEEHWTDLRPKSLIAAMDSR